MEKGGNSILCSKNEAIEIVRNMEQLANEEICQLNFLFGCKIPLTPKIYAMQYPMGFGVEADLYYDGELLRHYLTPEEMMIDLMGLSMKKMRENIKGE